MVASHPVMLAHGMEASLSAAYAKLNSVGGGSMQIPQLCENRRAEGRGQRAVEWLVIYYLS